MDAPVGATVPKDLERDLGLFATITISLGAMIGSGIFVLPGFAAEKAGPAVVVAYLLAGAVVLPAALSKSEMATAMPESGGTYLFIDRAMGPLPGTIAGIGAWFSLVFKSAFALVGLGAYLLLFVSLPPGAVKVGAIGLAVLVTVVNVVGVKQSGRLQSLIVAAVLVVLALFVADGLTYVDQASYHPFFEEGSDGLLAATGFVFVSYAGVTKIASVAEEVEDPGRNIPIAILGSVVLMMFLYTFVVFVMVGVAPLGALNTETPMAVAAEAFAGPVGRIVIGVTAVLALTSMANAGILSSSRYPLAMSRDALAPPSFQDISKRFRTPIKALGLNGALLIALIAFVPVRDLAKLASAFQILVFVFINAALVAFRESDLESYDPEFVAPGYPWVQAAGIVGGSVLLTQMGMVPLLGALGIVATGLVWYRIYGRAKTDREGAALDALRGAVGSRAIAEIEGTDGGTRNVLVALEPDMSVERERTLLTLAGHVADHRDGVVHAVRFEEVPEQTSLASAADVSPRDRQFEAQTDTLATALSIPIETEWVVSHDVRRSIVNHAAAVDAGLLLGSVSEGRFHDEMFGHDVDWFMRNADCELALIRDRGLGDVDEIAVLAQRGPHGPLKVALASAIAAGADATVRFVTVVDEDATAELVARTETFHAELESLYATTPTTSEIIRSDDLVDSLAEATATADLAVLGHDPHTVVHDVLLSDLSNEISDRLSCSVLQVHSDGSSTFLRRLVKRALF
ncbi:MAG: APC family permease [Halorientalis sp.]